MNPRNKRPSVSRINSPLLCSALLSGEKRKVKEKRRRLFSLSVGYILAGYFQDFADRKWIDCTQAVSLLGEARNVWAGAATSRRRIKRLFSTATRRSLEEQRHKEGEEFSVKIKKVRGGYCKYAGGCIRGSKGIETDVLWSGVEIFFFFALDWWSRYIEVCVQVRVNCMKRGFN